MATNDTTYDTLQLVGLHVPDYSNEIDGDGLMHQVELPGFYQVGFIKDGVFRPIHTFKAAGFFADIRRAQLAAQEQSAAAPPPATPAPAATDTPPTA